MKLITEKVYSNILDPNIEKDISNSPIWTECWKEEEKPDNVKVEYTIKFDGTKPIQVTKIKKL